MMWSHCTRETILLTSLHIIGVASFFFPIFFFFLSFVFVSFFSKLHLLSCCAFPIARLRTIWKPSNIWTLCKHISRDGPFKLNPMQLKLIVHCTNLTIPSYFSLAITQDNRKRCGKARERGKKPAEQRAEDNFAQKKFVRIQLCGKIRKFGRISIEMFPMTANFIATISHT